MYLPFRFTAFELWDFSVGSSEMQLEWIILLSL